MIEENSSLVLFSPPSILRETFDGMSANGNGSQSSDILSVDNVSQVYRNGSSLGVYPLSSTSVIPVKSFTRVANSRTHKRVSSLCFFNQII